MGGGEASHFRSPGARSNERSRLSVVDDFAVFLRGAGFVFLLFVLFFVFLFPEETFLASFEEEDVPDGEDEDCARIREEIGKRIIFFFLDAFEELGGEGLELQ